MTTAHIDKLTPYARNSKRHPPEQIAAIAASIEEFGFVGAIVIRAGEIGQPQNLSIYKEYVVKFARSCNFL